MKKTILIAVLTLASVSSFADSVCTINMLENGKSHSKKGADEMSFKACLAWAAGMLDDVDSSKNPTAVVTHSALYGGKKVYLRMNAGPVVSGKTEN